MPHSRFLNFLGVSFEFEKTYQNLVLRLSLEPLRGATSVLEANGDVPLGGVAFSRLY